MALDLSQTQPQLDSEWPLSMFASGVEEGMGMQFLMENGTQVVTPGTGAANTNLFAGVSLSYFTAPTYGVAIDVITLDVNGNGTLSNSPLGTAFIAAFLNPTFDVNTGDRNDGQYVGGTALTYNANPGAGQFGFNGNNFSAGAANAGAVVVVQYRFALTAQQASFLVGDALPAKATDVTGTIGLIQKGRIFTTCFDVTQNWGAQDIGNITLSAGGIFTIGGTGAPVQAYVFAVPTNSLPYLGLYLRG